MGDPARPPVGWGRWWFETHRHPTSRRKGSKRRAPMTVAWRPAREKETIVVFDPPVSGAIVMDLSRHIDWWEGVDHKWDLPHG